MTDRVEWTDDWVQVMADWLVGFDIPYGTDDPAEKNPDGTLAWPQELGWEIRECMVGGTKAAIRHCLEETDA